MDTELERPPEEAFQPVLEDANLKTSRGVLQVLKAVHMCEHKSAKKAKWSPGHGRTGQ